MSIVLLRCDDRLIHGQCIVRVLNDYKVDQIILVDAFTAANPIMENVYKMSVPSTVKLSLVDPASGEAIELIERASADESSTLVLVKDPVVVLDLQKRTDSLPKSLDIGPMSNRAGTRKVTYFSFLLQAEEQACEGLSDFGVRVFFQQVPGEKAVEWSEVKQ